MVVVVGGPQYRVGSHRLFVHLARRLALCGHAVLRFDARGMGDSSGDLRISEHVAPDMGRPSMDLCNITRRSIGWCSGGSVSGASAALMYVGTQRDDRVAGLCLLNPWVRHAATLARTPVLHHYYSRGCASVTSGPSCFGAGSCGARCWA